MRAGELKELKNCMVWTDYKFKTDNHSVLRRVQVVDVSYHSSKLLFDTGEEIWVNHFSIEKNKAAFDMEFDDD